MKFFTPLVACAALVAAREIPKAQSQQSVDVILQAVANISAGAQNLSTGVANVKSLADAGVVLTTSNALIATLKTAITQVNQLQGIRGVDALQLTWPILNLRSTVETVVSAVIEKKEIFTNASLGSVVYDALTQDKCRSQQFTNVTKARLPAGGLHAVADNLVNPIFAAMDMGLAAYADSAKAANYTAPNCTIYNSTSIDGVEGAAVGLSANRLGLVVAAGLAVVLVL